MSLVKMEYKKVQRLKHKNQSTHKTQSHIEGKHNTLFQFRKNLYVASLYIYGFHSLKDLLFLKSDCFLKLCELDDIDWCFNQNWLDKGFFKSCPKVVSKKKRQFQFSCPLNSRSNHYGELMFFSSQKILKRKKDFLKKISIFLASALHFMENKEKMENVKRQWGTAFDSFPQAFCITDKNFKIIRVNQTFLKMSRTKKTELSLKNLFELVPSLKIPKPMDKEGSFQSKGDIKGWEFCWEVSYKTLFLKKENIRAFLFLIRDITQEKEIEEKLAYQAQERELGLIKGSIAHELNNPIAGVKTLLHVVEKQVSPQKPLIKESLREMQKAIDRCHQMVRHLLFISKHKERGSNELSLNSDTPSDIDQKMSIL